MIGSLSLQILWTIYLLPEIVLDFGGRMIKNKTKPKNRRSAQGAHGKDSNVLEETKEVSIY